MKFSQQTPVQHLVVTIVTVVVYRADCEICNKVARLKFNVVLRLKKKSLPFFL